MYSEKKKKKKKNVLPYNIKTVTVNTGNEKRKFKLMTKCTSKYLNSPLYKGATLWDEFDKEVQDIPTPKLFLREIMKTQRVYIDLIN